MFVFEATSYRKVRCTSEFKTKRQLRYLAGKKLAREERNEQSKEGQEESKLHINTKRRRRQVRSSAV